MANLRDCIRTKCHTSHFVYIPDKPFYCNTWRSKSDYILPDTHQNLGYMYYINFSIRECLLIRSLKVALPHSYTAWFGHSYSIYVEQLVYSTGWFCEKRKNDDIYLHLTGTFCRETKKTLRTNLIRKKRLYLNVFTF